MRVLVACEYSGIVRDAFINKGHEAISCDALPTESLGPHYQGDIRDLMWNTKWDLIIAHPPCTRLANSGVRWLHERNLWPELDQACRFFRLFLEAVGKVTDKVAIENPTPHKYAVERIGRKYDQIIQPWQFGHGESKAICLWLQGLPKLQPTNVVTEREQKVWKMPPGEERSKERARFYEGIAEGMANQWE